MGLNAADVLIQKVLRFNIAINLNFLNGYGIVFGLFATVFLSFFSMFQLYVTDSDVFFAYYVC